MPDYGTEETVKLNAGALIDPQAICLTYGIHQVLLDCCRILLCHPFVWRLVGVPLFEVTVC